jgi:parallel beta-helix repeat protein
MSRFFFALTLGLFTLGAASALATTGPDPRGPHTPFNEGAVECVLESTNLSGPVELDPQCVYRKSVVIQESNTTLDCRGARIEGDKFRSITIKGDIDNVVVRDCYMISEGGILVSPPPRQEGESDEEWRARSPTGVHIENVHIKGTIGTGIFIGPAVVGVTFEKSIVEDAGSAGIYLEYATQHNVIRDNLVRNNGYRAGGDELPRTGWARREGIAVDASAFNLIENNTVESNAFGGVFLYKNCWEYHTDADQEQRHQHAHSNVIRGNHFRDQDFGVWVASRQARDMGAWLCGDDTPYDNPFVLDEVFHENYPMFEATIPTPYTFNTEYLYAASEGYFCPPVGVCNPFRSTVYIWEDFAENNTIEGNVFEAHGKAGIRVEDDDTRITGNLFVGAFEYIYLGTPIRSRYLNRPVEHTVITGNSYVDSEASAFSDQLALVPGEHVETVLSNNGRVCLDPWGQRLLHGQAVLAFESETGGAQGCVSEERECEDGMLSGSFVFAQCENPEPEEGETLNQGPVESNVNPEEEDDLGVATPIPDPESAAEYAASGPSKKAPPGPASGCSSIRPSATPFLLLAILLLLRRRKGLHPPL